MREFLVEVPDCWRHCISACTPEISASIFTFPYIHWSGYLRRARNLGQNVKHIRSQFSNLILLHWTDEFRVIYGKRDMALDSPNLKLTLRFIQWIDRNVRRWLAWSEHSASLYELQFAGSFVLQNISADCFFLQTSFALFLKTNDRPVKGWSSYNFACPSLYYDCLHRFFLNCGFTFSVTRMMGKCIKQIFSPSYKYLLHRNEF